MPNICNQKCSHCYFTEGEGSRFVQVTPTLLSEVETLIDYFHLNTPQRGDSRLYPREITTAMDLLPFYEEMGVDRVLTNAALINAKTVSEFKAHGIKSATVSLHGDQKQHMALTGGTAADYERTLSGIMALKAAGIDISIFTTVHHGNWQAVPALVQFLSKANIIDIKFLRFVPEGNSKGNSDENLLTKEDVINFLYLIEETRMKYPGLRISLFGLTFGPNFYSPSFFKT